MKTLNDIFKKCIKKFDADVIDKLEQRINARISYARNVRNRIHIVLHSIVGITSLFFLMLALQYIHIQTYQSGFYEYLSLMISDSSLIITHWRALVMSIAGSIPITGFALFVASLFILINSAQRGLKHTQLSRIAFIPKY